MRPALTRRPVWLGLAVALLVAAGAVVGGLVLSHTGTPSASAAQLASLRTGCQQWLASDRGQPGDDSWCNDMGDWMTQRMSRYGMGPEMMWGAPDRMLATCEQWMAARPPAGAATTPQQWCQTMVTWMASHTAGWTGENSWGGWMHGPMMGGP